MDFVEAEGDSIDAAIDNALKLLGAPRDRVTIEILSEGRKGILGFGAQKAKVRATLRKSSIEQDDRVGSIAPAAPASPPGEAMRAMSPADLSALSAKARSALDEILRSE